MDADHCIFDTSNVPLSVGDRLRLIPGQQDAMISRWDTIVGIRDQKVEIVWDILARGTHS